MLIMNCKQKILFHLKRDFFSQNNMSNLRFFLNKNSMIKSKK